MKLIGYIRVSTKEQATDGHSLQTQREQIQRYCEAFDHELVGIIEDAGVSASKPFEKRAGGQKVMDVITQGNAEGLVVARIDRAWRVALDGLLTFAWFSKQGVSFHSWNERVDTGTPEGKFQLITMLGMAEMELDRIRQRTKDAMQGLKDRGAVYGTIPFGTKAVDGMLYRDPKTWKVRQTIIRARNRKKPIPYRKLAAQLSNRVAAPSGGKTWHVSTLQGIIKNHTDVAKLPLMGERHVH